jgi:hypothetical protein
MKIYAETLFLNVRFNGRRSKLAIHATFNWPNFGEVYSVVVIDNAILININGHPVPSTLIRFGPRAKLNFILIVFIYRIKCIIASK